jgi:hypothetical protein
VMFQERNVGTIDDELSLSLVILPLWQWVYGPLVPGASNDRSCRPDVEHSDEQSIDNVTEGRRNITRQSVRRRSQ